MPMYFSRWPDGTFSLVHAGSEQDAYVQLDELGDEPAELRPMESCLVDLRCGSRENASRTLSRHQPRPKLETAEEVLLQEDDDDRRPN